MSSALADMFRYNIRNDRTWVTVREEINQLKDYLTIQQIRFGDKLSAEWNIDEELWDAKLLKMTLQPLAENAIFHGLERKKGKGKLTVEIRNADGSLFYRNIGQWHRYFPGQTGGNSPAAQPPCGLRSII
jgi:two-component system sensor histidine kinase YesM